MTGFMLQNQQISLFQMGTQNVNTYNIVEQANFAKKEISPILHSLGIFASVTSQSHSEKGISNGNRKAISLFTKQLER